MARLLTKTLPTIILPHGDPKAARAAWAKFRIDNGRKSYGPLLTMPGDNMKLDKSERPTYGLSLAPHSLSGFNVCPSSTPSCRAGCVAYSGNGGFRGVAAGRVLRVQFLAEHPEHFATLLDAELRKGKAKAARKGQSGIAMRLNTFSDLPWHTLTPWLFTDHADVQFYDYTKVWSRGEEILPVNWHLTFSASERTTADQILAMVERGYNVATVFSTGRTKPLPATFHGAPIIDGDKSDDRAEDPRGVIVGLRAKGKMRTNMESNKMVFAA